LVVVAICAVWLGIAFHRAREQARAVAAIKAAQGYVFYDYQGTEWDSFDERDTSDVPSWLLENVGVDFFHDVTLVVCDVVPVNDDILEIVGALSEVSYLVFLSSDVTDDGLAHLKPLRRLQVLKIVTGENDAGECGAPDFGDAGLSVVAELRELRDLRIECANIGDRALTHLEGSTQLRSILLVDTQVTAAGAEALGKSLPQCVIRVYRGDKEVFVGGPGAGWLLTTDH
jgi:hypothetical protein